MKDYYNIRDSYKLYREEETNPIGIKTYVSIINGYMKFLIRRLLDKGEILIPERLGRLRIVGKKVKIRIEEGEIKGLAPDWPGTKKLWAENEEAKNNKVLVFYFNEETNGIRYRFFWSKNRVLLPNKTIYNLKLTRANKRALSALIKEGKEYLVIN